MKLDAFDHPKTEKLAELLGLPMYSAWGLLEGLFGFAANKAKTGVLGGFEDRYIERKLFWDGEPGKLIDAFVAAGFLERHECCAEHRILIHDWPEHWPNHIRQSVVRKLGLRAGDEIPAHIFGPCSPKGAQCSPNGAQCSPNGSNPAETGTPDNTSEKQKSNRAPPTETETRDHNHNPAETGTKPRPAAAPASVPASASVLRGGKDSVSGLGRADGRRFARIAQITGDLHDALMLPGAEQIARGVVDEKQAAADHTDLVENVGPAVAAAVGEDDDFLETIVGEARDCRSAEKPLAALKARLRKMGIDPPAKNGKPRAIAEARARLKPPENGELVETLP